MTLMEQYGAQRRSLPLWSLLSRVALAILAGFFLFPRSPQGSAREPSTTFRAQPDFATEGALRALGRALIEREDEIIQANHLNATRAVEPLLRPSIPVLLARVPSVAAATTYAPEEVRTLLTARPFGPLATLQPHADGPGHLSATQSPPQVAVPAGAKSAPSETPSSRVGDSGEELLPHPRLTRVGSAPNTAHQQRSSDMRAEPVPRVREHPGLARGVLAPEVTGSTHLKKRALSQEEDPQRRCRGQAPHDGSKDRGGTCVLRVRG
jgi:hypothetical protein